MNKKKRGPNIYKFEQKGVPAYFDVSVLSGFGFYSLCGNIKPLPFIGKVFNKTLWWTAWNLIKMIKYISNISIKKGNGMQSHIYIYNFF